MRGASARLRLFICVTAIENAKVRKGTKCCCPFERIRLKDSKFSPEGPGWQQRVSNTEKFDVSM